MGDTGLIRFGGSTIRVLAWKFHGLYGRGAELGRIVTFAQLSERTWHLGVHSSQQ